MVTFYENYVKMIDTMYQSLSKKMKRIQRLTAGGADGGDRLDILEKVVKIA